MLSVSGYVELWRKSTKTNSVLRLDSDANIKKKKKDKLKWWILPKIKGELIYSFIISYLFSKLGNWMKIGKL